jgi:hypothetical protein
MFQRETRWKPNLEYGLVKSSTSLVSSITCKKWSTLPNTLTYTQLWKIQQIKFNMRLIFLTGYWRTTFTDAANMACSTKLWKLQLWEITLDLKLSPKYLFWIKMVRMPQNLLSSSLMLQSNKLACFLKNKYFSVQCEWGHGEGWLLSLSANIRVGWKLCTSVYLSRASVLQKRKVLNIETMDRNNI